MIRKIRKAAVIGSGTMGSGIAALFAGAGIQTLLLDIVPPDLKENEKGDISARNRLAQAGLDHAIKSKPPLFMHVEDAARITTGNLEDDFNRLSECDWIIEVVVENLKIKQELLKRIETVRKNEAIVSSNTSGIPLRKMSESLSLEFRRHFLGTHFFNPVRYMKLLEIIPGEDTRLEILAFIADFSERILGKGIVWAKDTPGFAGNRIGIHGIINVMQRLVEEDLTIPEVDALFGPVIGRPKSAMFGTVDLIGLDILSHVAKNTYEMVVNDEDRECLVLPGFVDRMIEKNLLGKKTKAGFYKTEVTPESKKIRKAVDPNTLEYTEFAPPDFSCLSQALSAKSLSEKISSIVYGKDKGARFAWSVLANGFLYAANRIPEIADTITDIDNAMKWGYNFEMGPFEMWDAVGLEKSVKKMEAEGLPIPSKITDMINSGCKRFYKTENGRVLYYDFAAVAYKEQIVNENMISLHSLRTADKVVNSCPSASLIDLGDGVFCCEFHTKMNAVNREIIDFLYDGFDYVDQNGIGLVIGNQAGGVPGAFSVGGDLSYMASLAKDKKYSEMEEFIKSAQEGIQHAGYADFPVIAAPYGLTLGGGCEICLASDRIVAHAELYMGLVEIGVGLLPSGGGCLNLWKKFVNAIPNAVKGYDLSKFFMSVFMSIATAKVSTSAADARSNGFLVPSDRIVFNRDYLIAEAKKEVVRMAEAGYAPPLKKKIPVMGQAARSMVRSEIDNMLQGKFITEYDAFLAERLAFVISGGDTKGDNEIDELAILKLEREAFVDFWKEEKTLARVDHMLKTGKPLRN